MKSFMYIGLLLIVLITTGCWDRTEINDIAFVIGTAMDLTEDGKILGSVQIALPPSAQGGPGKSGKQEQYFMISAVGNNSSEVIRNLQDRLSRRLFYAHRSVVFIGEQLARHGIKDVLDHFSRDPRTRLRTFIMVAKGAEGREMLQIRYPFEQVPSEAVREMEVSRAGLGVTMRDLFIAAASEGIDPVMGVIEKSIPSEGIDDSEDSLFRLAGAAVFKEFKLAGFLNNKETRGLLWVLGKMEIGRITAVLPGDNGNVGMVLTDSKRRITADVRGGKIKVHILLEGNGNLYENNTKLDIGQTENLEHVQTALEKSVETEVRDLLKKAQKKYKVDAIGIGQTIYRDQPGQWKRLKEKWDKQFPEAEIALTVKLSIKGTGMAGPPLLLEEKEIKKK
jgi:spore germination protein KC